ncbi:bifunctional diaminohydroxyphosphoribosylaminopyrimidine deaminase/5-amino-6-(5-phosphoribosylamino)uracil reductase RibD [Cellulomonas sp. NPDC089187]|uniref:bifunctional diaminohydroxyphosphoribosylaminopyrimidine deaminase/5-amino-6-(5-phosphoribosylamino)uracil reductase RibD n=1 Tax=Cellulomonas sp. NPDC089187 TaxID=3154970 RepID=UPI00341325AC
MAGFITDEAAMAHALELALRGPAAGPNPRVGCVLLRDGQVIGEGWHRGAGTPHAEVDALCGVDARGATAVVTLEPCAHTGRTGPCAQALIDAGVAEVVIAVEDPNPVAGGGAQLLRAAGIEVRTGVGAESVRRMLEPWLVAVGRGRPFVTLKLASTLDGRVAAADGSSRWITSAESREHAHRLRAEVDAILVGTGTALIDRPALTARLPDGSLAEHQPLRVVLGDREVPGDWLRITGHDPAEALAQLAAREVRHVLVEGGPTVSAAFLRAGMVDRVLAYIAPVLLGDGRSAVQSLGIGTLADGIRLRTEQVQMRGPDVLLSARVEEEI